MPETRGRVLVTRPAPGAEETAGRLTALGFTPVLAPMLAIEPLRPSLPGPDRLQALVVASGNALAGLSPGFQALPLLAVGDATAARACAAGFALVYSAGADAAALAALAGRLCRPAAGPLLLAAGAGQGARLAAALRALGFRVIRRAVYRARPATALPEAAAAALADGEIGAALFFSAETARAFVRCVRAAGLAGSLAGVEAIVIGEPAAEALRGLPFRRVRVALRPNQTEMLALLS